MTTEQPEQLITEEDEAAEHAGVSDDNPDEDDK